jgi:hypothetical protein
VHSGDESDSSSSPHNPISRKSNRFFYILKDQFISQSAGLLPKGVLSPQFKAVFKASISTKQILVVTLKHPFYLNSPRAHTPSHQLVTARSHRLARTPTPFPPLSINLLPLILHAFSLTLLSKNLLPSFLHLFSNCHLEFSAPGRKIVKFMGAGGGSVGGWIIFCRPSGYVSLERPLPLPQRNLHSLLQALSTLITYVSTLLHAL